MALMAMALCDADEVVFQEKSEGMPSLVLIREGGELSTNHSLVM